MALDPARRDRIVASATELFSAYGYRRTSMDQLAQAAGVAKPTLYAYFDDKEAVFAAVVESVLDLVVADARAATVEGGTLEERLVGILTSKFTRIFTLVHSSPHAADLLSSGQEASQEAVERADADVRELLATQVASASRRHEVDLARASVTRSGFVEALLEAGYGADALATTEKDHRDRISRHVRLLLAGVQHR